MVFVILGYCFKKNKYKYVTLAIERTVKIQIKLDPEVAGADSAWCNLIQVNSKFYNKASFTRILQH